MAFKVGDWVITPDGPGEIISIDEDSTSTAILVSVAGENEWYYSESELGLLSGNSVEAIKNRAEHFEELGKLAEQFGVTSFEQNVRRILDGVADTVASKNIAYGDSALNPIRVFSKADRMEQLFVRLDDKLSRVQKGHEYPGDDTIRDIIGYCTLILIARESE